MAIGFSANPFGLPSDWKNSEGYTTPVTAISSVLVQNFSCIFSYKTFSEPELLDEAIKTWVQKGSTGNLRFEELELRSGAGLAPLGFAKASSENSVFGIITPGYGLSYFANSFQREKENTNRFLLNVGALNYDEKSGQVVSDYITPVKTAAALGFPVVSPIAVDEVKQTTLLSLALAKFGQPLGAVNLFDGPNYAKSVLNITEKQDQDIISHLSKSLAVGSTFDQILDKFNENASRKLHNFEYYGDENAETVFVSFGGVESELFRSSVLENESKIGLIAIRIPLPFDTAKFVTLIPKSAKNVVVVGQSLDGQSPTYLKSQVSAALFAHKIRSVKVSEYLYLPTFVWSPNAVEQVLSSFVPEFTTAAKHESENFIYWASDSSVNLDVAARLVHSLSLVDNREVSLRTKFDNNANGGTFQAQFVSSNEVKTSLVSNVDVADVTIVENLSLLNAFDVASSCKENSTIVVISEKSLKEKNISDAKVLVEDLKIPGAFLKQLTNKGVQLVFLDTETIGDKEETKGRTSSFVMQAAFWKYAYKLSVAESVRRIWSSAGSDIELLAAVLSDTITTAFEVGLFEVSSEELSATLANVETNADEEPTLSSLVAETCFQPNPKQQEEVLENGVSSVANISQHLSFKEAFATQSSLRPDLPVRNYVVKVKENRRVTPADYDRYIFHIEFDITGTGLTYGIGEALGVHARNNPDLVKEFLIKYGLNEQDIIQVPNREHHQLFDSRTVLQAFTENLDIFGKPPKAFYQSLIEFASNDDEKMKLEDLVSAAGAVELKKYQDIEYYTYADIFELFPSARPALKDLVRIIAPMKRREYSIASSQRVHPNEVHLLIVVVDWIDNKGRKRYGQASKYLSDLSVGSELVVSVKPSVMKLPPSPEQPVIMSGLGTGLAPFKAIVEEKFWQQQQGHKIGKVFLYLGSRHKREEYLYGELWEAYKDAGIITHIGAAFSRDQPHKIYIQDKIRESLGELRTAMIDENGSFYLCGPTWPVPDITSALQDIIQADADERGEKVNLEEAIEDLKETSRYILEVY
ncbi:LANO_0F10242g1_1 [Lachancea nothofagi CBS 11611]|uniref:assimilatory sulfite reductase (NADPH) n=1 Tax=Lachancea nothofagi CBS 11611 TaxID=1266666 RepID=A0A1G4KAE3_9SACH|nr:LANO_0F10242g1_1 [Lachancea nothofagi CBS 11611]